MRILLVTAAVVAAVTVLALATLPPAHLPLPQPFSDEAIPGILHIHTIRSDGRSSPDVIAAAAARAGLKFVVFTDHGDATRTPDPPVYRSGVLCIDAVEISTNGGHYLALDMPASPYPLGGEARDVVDDVRRLGGFGIVAHPDSPKRELQWRDWTAPFDGIEVVNPDTGWRLLAQQGGWRPTLRLVDAFLTYPFRPAETISGLLSDVSETTARWNTLIGKRQVVATSGADAHAVLGWRDNESRSGWSLPLPSYEASFRSLSIHVRPARSLSGDPATDAAAIITSIRRGHLYSAIEGLATAPSFEFTAENRQGRAQQGETLSPTGPVTVHVRSNAPESFTTTIWAGDVVLKTTRAPELTVTAAEAPAVYRVEIRTNGPSRPIWLLSNPIYLGRYAPLPIPAHRPVVDVYPLFDSSSEATGEAASGLNRVRWRTEADAMSTASTNGPTASGGGELQFRYQMSPVGTPGSHVALLGEMATAIAPNDRLLLVARADRPMRAAVQFRTTTAGLPEERWTRSVYLDTAAREQTIYLDDVTPVGATRTKRPPLEDIRDVLLVVDRTNTKPGSSGTIWIRRMALER